MYKITVGKITLKYTRNIQGASKGRPQKRGHKKLPWLSTRSHSIFKIKQRHWFFTYIHANPSWKITKEGKFYLLIFLFLIFNSTLILSHQIVQNLQRGQFFTLFSFHSLQRNHANLSCYLSSKKGSSKLLRIKRIRDAKESLLWCNEVEYD